MSPLEKIREALEAAGSRTVSRGSDAFSAQCPAHEDRNPSLSVRVGDSDSVVLYCHAGCDTDSVVGALGLSMRDLYAKPGGLTYTYTDRLGATVRTVMRKPDKRFTQKVGEKGAATLYRLPEVLAAVQAGKPVWLVEGEKDAGSVRLAGGVATTTPAGASNLKNADLSPLAGADVRVIPDNDGPGEKYARDAAEVLLPIAKSVTFYRAPVGKDFSDAYATGKGLDDLEPYEPAWLSEVCTRPGRKVLLRPLSGVTPKPVRWLWDRRVPLGELTIIGGREGLGKSTVLAWVAAQVTRGTLPGSLDSPRPVLWVTSEDSLEYVLVPRLLAAGADMGLIMAVTVERSPGNEENPLFPLDEVDLGAKALEVGAALLIVDPLVSSLASDVDTHRDHSLRQALDPLRKMAEGSGMSVIGALHENKTKNASDYGDKLLGARTFSAVARSVLGVVVDKDDPEGRRRYLGVSKSNLTNRLDVPGLLFQVDDTPVSPGVTTGAVRWLGEESSRAVDYMLNMPADDGDDHDEATSWLCSFLTSEGGEAPRTEVLKAGKAQHFTDKMLSRAAERLGVKRERRGFAGGSVWVLPPEAGATPQEPPRQAETPAPSPSPVLCRVRECEADGTERVALGGRDFPVCLKHRDDPNLSRSTESGGEELVIVGQSNAEGRLLA